MPGLYNLLKDGILPERFFVVGMARRPFTNEEFRGMMKKSVDSAEEGRTIAEVWRKLENNLYYQPGFFEDDAPYGELVKLLASFDKEVGACVTRFFYLATPPKNYSTILTKLSSSKLSEGCGQGSNKWTRVLIEKPFGNDLDTALALEKQLSDTFEEKQIYRIDHYLAKDTIQNILAFRFGNRLFESQWNREHIDHIQITVAESEGVGSRGKFYDPIGAVRDVAQNHMMAMLAYTTMDEPASLSASDLRQERVKVLSSIRYIEPSQVSGNVVRGQYGSGIIEGEDVLGFRQEKDINPDSMTETYAAFKLFIDNKRWKNVPFYLRTGKRMAKSVVKIDVIFKKPQTGIFDNLSRSGAFTNILTFRIQPQEGISLRFFAKEPGLTFKLDPVDMHFSYSEYFKEEIIDSYKKILIDSMTGDQTLFATAKGFYTSWQLITRILKGWEKEKPVFPNYKAGTWGPKEAEELIRRDGRSWIK